MATIKSVAIIGAGPAGVIALDALAQEQAFDKIQLFERREKAGGVEIRSELNIKRHGKNSPFRHWKVVEQYIQGLVDRRGYPNLVSYNTTVELVHKDPHTSKWTLTLRKPLENGTEDRWWTESFDAVVVVATGHYSVPFIPSTPGFLRFLKTFPARYFIQRPGETQRHIAENV
ncbi:hypothetical protein DID88_005083 [Monilinia fructigena]|uniref:FAD/NAD(P)-binding domain-containing protein n=1 Tax=Monilinia fructigena TaxID=38457 RepID=A0A395ISE5_9HELO|nr:hypothetical protein DID88_005083 [Monilinia fructigena]